MLYASIRKLLSCLVVLLFLTIFSHAQTVITQKGLTTVKFNLPQGGITAYITDGIAKGEQVTIGFSIDPAGNNEKQRSKALDELLKSELRVGDPNNPTQTTQSLAQHFNQDTRSGLLQPVMVSSIFAVSLIDPKKETQTVPIEIRSMNLQTMSPGSGCSIPTHALAGSPLRITGPFDGDASNTKCSLDNKPLEVLAESPRQCFVSYPENAKSIQTLNVQENNQSPCSQQVSGVEMNVSAGKLNLQKGQKTYIDISITGLQNLPDTAKLTLNNITPGTVIMLPSDYVLIPLPPSSVGTGTFNRRFDIQSITTGSFTVNVDLDLPDPTFPLDWNPVKQDTPVANIPPGQIAKRCSCFCEADITTVKTKGKGLLSYHADVKGNCDGVCGVGTGTFTKCQLQNVTYEWVIATGGDKAQIVGANNGPDVMVQFKEGPKDVFLQLNATTVCKDCNKCTRSIGKFITDEPIPPPRVDSPGTAPNTRERISKKCKCSCNSGIAETGRSSISIDLAATAMGSTCEGEYGVEGSFKKCGLASVTFTWAVLSGANVVRINGPANLGSVKLGITGSGPFSVMVTVLVTCLDGGTCGCSSVFSDDIPPPITNKCELVPEEKMEPKMDGGLKPKYIVSGKQISKDGLIALGAEGMDMDQLKWTCQPKPGCTDTKSEKTILLNGRVRFVWNITAGEGDFVKSGSLPEDIKTDEGENVIFKPALIPLPVRAADTSVTTTIKLSVIDDNLTQPLDPQVDRTITIIVKRSRSKPDFYSVDIRSEKYSLPGPVKVSGIPGTCITVGPDWAIADELTKPVINLPAVADKDKIMPGQWIVLNTNDERDKDNLTINCNSKNKCKTDPWSKIYEDQVIWTWSIVSGGGKFVSDPTGRFIIYETPTVIPKEKDFIEVKIHVKVTNAGGKINDKEMDDEIVFRVHKPG